MAIHKQSKRARNVEASRWSSSTKLSPCGKTPAPVTMTGFYHNQSRKLSGVIAQYDVDQTGTDINSIQKQITQKKKAKEDADDLLQQKNQLQMQKKAKEEIVASKRDVLQKKVRLVGNYVHESVPVSTDEVNNEIVRAWTPEGFDPGRKPGLSHHEVLWRLDGYDPVRGVKLVGHRGYW